MEVDTQLRDQAQAGERFVYSCPHCLSVSRREGAFCPHCGLRWALPRLPRRSVRARLGLPLAASALVLGVGIGGYVAGHSGGPSLKSARTAGERLGAAQGFWVGEREGYARGYPTGYGSGYRSGYRASYRIAYRHPYAPAPR